MSDDNETETGDGDLPLEEFDGEAAMAAAIAEEQAEAETNADEQAEAKASGDEEPVIQTPKQATDLQAVYDIPVQVSAVLGKATMQVSQLLKLGRGAVVELDRRVGEAIDIYVNNRLVARGEVVVVDERLGVTMTEIIKSDRSS
jgi:flagellar motor switch protein FliN/FliY